MPISSRPHHYGQLVERWRAVAKTAGLRMRRIGFADEKVPIFALKSPALAAEGGIYVSAGIHGDEPATCEALIAWAEKHGPRLARWPLLLLPCLNPWGLRNNVRFDRAGVDLNRAFHVPDHPVIAGVKSAVGALRFEAALMLHEDYDGEGFYLYEFQQPNPLWGEDLLRVAARHVPIDPREKIDGRKAQAGVIRRRFDRALFERIGYPESAWLHEFHVQRALTVETPSEFDFARRVRTHIAVIEECVRRVMAG